MQPTTLYVFISSTWLDLQPEREAVEAVLQRLRETKFTGMEYFGSRDESTHHASLNEVDRSQVYVGIFGGRYGSGITEAEYRRARERGLPCFIYFKDEANILAEGRETDPEQAARLVTLKEELRRSHTVTTFTNPDDLAAKVTADLHHWLFDEYLAPRLEKAARGEIPREQAQALLEAIKDLSALNWDLLARLREAGYVIAQGERSVAVGRDAIRSIFITGDHNQLFVGDYEHLGDAYIKPWSVFERVHLEHFTGRDWLITEVDAFLRDNDRGYFVLEAKAGLGKTTFLAHLVKEQGYIHHFLELALGLDGITPGLRNLAAQLVRVWELKPYSVDQVLPGAATRPDFLQNLLFEAARRRDEIKPGEKIVLVVDALDEAGTPSGQNVLGLPRVLPKGVYFVVSQRPVEVPLVVEGPRRVFRLEATDEQNLTDMQAYLKCAATWEGVSKALQESGCLPEQFVETLLAKCQGVWIYLHYVVGEIERGERSPLDLDTLPQGLWQYYAQYWQRWRKQHPDDWDGVHLPLLSTLAAVQEDVSLGLLCTLAGVTERPALRRLLEEVWRPFLTVGEGKEPRYRLYHASLREFFEGRADLSDLTAQEQALAHELTEATRLAHARVADRYLTSWGELEAGLPELKDPTKRDMDDRYGLRHLAAHLEKAGRVEDLHLLLQVEWHYQEKGPMHAHCENAWYTVHEQAGDISRYLSDVARAMRLADEAYANSRSPVAIGHQCRYALLTASVNSLAQNIPPGLLVALMEKQVWEVAQGLTYARRAPEPYRRAQLLAALAPYLPEQLVREALLVARGIEPEIRARALEGLLPRLAELDCPDKTLEAVRTIGDDNACARVLIASARYLTQSLLNDALEIAQAIKQEDVRAEALAGLAQRACNSIREKVLEEALATARAIKDKLTQGQALARLTPYLPESLLQEALTLASKIKSEKALAALALRLADVGHSREGLKIAVKIGYEVERTDALATLARRFADAGNIEDALKAAQAISDENTRMRILADLLPDLRQPLKDKILKKLLKSARASTSSGVVEVLGMLVRHLQEPLRSEVLGEALARARKIEAEHGWGLALMRLAIRLPEPLKDAVLGEALAVARAIPHKGTRNEEVVPMLAPHLPVPLLREALAVVRALGDEPARIGVLAALLPDLREPLQYKVRNDLLAALRSITDAQTRAYAFMQLDPRAVELLKPELIEEALGAARTIQQPDDRARTLVDILPLLQEEQLKDEVSQEAFVAAKEARKRAITSEEKHVEILIALLPHVRGKLKNKVLREALKEAWEALKEAQRNLWESPSTAGDLPRLIKSRRRCVIALAELVPQLPETTKAKVLVELWEAIQAIGDEVGRVLTLAEVALTLAPMLPPDTQEEILAAVEMAALKIGKEDTWDIRDMSDSEWMYVVAMSDFEIGRNIEQRELDIALTILVLRLFKLGRRFESAMKLCELIKSEGCQAYALAGLLVEAVPRMPEEKRGEWAKRALRAQEKIKEEERAKGLAKLAPYLSGPLLDRALAVSQAIGNQEARKKALRGLISQVIVPPPDTLYALWREILSTLVTRTREDLLSDLTVLVPVIATLGREEAVGETALAVQDVGRWWP